MGFTPMWDRSILEWPDMKDISWHVILLLGRVICLTTSMNLTKYFLQKAEASPSRRASNRRASL